MSTSSYRRPAATLSEPTGGIAVASEMIDRVSVTDETLDWRWKGFPSLPPGTRASEFVAARPSLFTAGFSWPIATLNSAALDHNIAVLADWCRAHDLWLAPHGKTSMAPAIFRRQLAAGAWAVTAATPWQVKVYRANGIKRIVLANELVDVEFTRWVAAERASDPDFELFCYVDSTAGVELLAGALDAGAASPLPVLIERGPVGGRTGCRSIAEALAVGHAVAEHEALALVGVAGFEGPFGHGRDAASLDGVREFVRSLADTLRELDTTSLLDDRAPYFVLSCGGSAQVDVVTEALGEPIELSRPVRRVLRSGAYATHDNGLYAESSSLAPHLRAAIEVWCQVLSRPEPGLALLGAGRRDVSADSGLPMALWRRSVRGGAVVPFRAAVSKVNDQHAFLDLAASDELEVGDLVGLGISHPCTTHDKWQLMPLLDDERRVIDCVRSYF